MSLRRRRNPPAWETLYDVDLVAAVAGADTDLGITNGAKTVAGKTWTLATQAGMLDTGAGAPSGLYMGGAANEGLRFGLGATTSNLDHDDAEAGTPGGPILYATMGELCGTTLWPTASQLATGQVISGIVIAAIVDASAMAGNRMCAGITIAADNTFVRGSTYGVSFTTVANAIWSQDIAAFGTPYEVPLATWSGMTRTNVAIAVVVGNNSTKGYYAMTDGINFPRSGWFTSVYSVIGASSLPAGLGDILAHNCVAGLCVSNSSLAGAGTEIDFKRFGVFALKNSMLPFASAWGDVTCTNP